ncbi:MAG: sensor histidine kinase [Actinomycetota bacterium]
MSAEEDRSRAFQALLAATSLDVVGIADAERAERLLRALMQALGARLAVLEVVDDRTGDLNVAAVVGDAPGDAVALGSSILATEVLRHGFAREVGPDEARALLPGVAVAAGLRYGAALPLHGQGRQSGVVWAASAEPLVADDGCRHAARVVAERLAWLQERARLYATLERAMAQILESDERMLGRIGLDIHDGPTQHLSVALLEVQLLDAELADAESAGATLPEVLRPALGRIYETLGGALHEMRELIGHLRPAQFESRRLPEILRDAMIAFESRTGNAVESEVRGEFDDRDVSLSQKITFYRILQEALNNAHRHGQARSVAVRLNQDPGGIALEVADDGKGFAPESVQRPRAGVPQARYGLHGMRDRAQLLGGSFTIDSRPGAGTTVRVYLPRWAPQEPASQNGVGG